MERDAIISHGASRVLKERLFDVSDPYQITVCNNCGMVISTPNECTFCNNDGISKCNIPYAASLLFQEIKAMGIKVVMKSTS